MRTGTPKYTSPHLDLPDGEEWIAYDTITRILENDGRFGTIINTFVKFNGSVSDTFEPAYDWCPFCRVAPFPSESNWITETQHLGPLALRITLAVKGTAIRELMNLWTAMHKAVLPSCGTPEFKNVQELTVKAGITKPTIQMSAYGMTPEDADGARMLVADGTITFGLFIPT